MTKSPKISSETWRCRWICPDPAPLSRGNRQRFEHILQQISGIAGMRFDIVDCVGLELRLAFLAVNGGGPASDDNDYWKDKCRALFLRPAVEPVILSNWARLRDLDLDLAKAQRIASALAAGPQVYRRGEGVGRTVHGEVGFEPAARARGWLERLKAASGRADLAAFMPIYAFAATIMAHPFGDGNGRLARALTMGALARFAGWNGPAVGLAPSFYRHAERLGLSLDEVTASGDWDPVAVIFLDILEDACALTALLRRRREERSGR